MRLTLELSDLFFNHQHPHFERLCAESHVAKEHPHWLAMEEAIAKDAEEFAETFTSLGVTAKQLTADFMRRL